MKHYVVLLVTVLLLSSAWPAPATSATLRADLTHADSGRGFTKSELLHRMFVRSRPRAAKLCPSGSMPSPGRANPVTAPVVRGASLSSAEYVMHFGIGTPRPQRVALEVDTGSDLIWTQCRPCFKCFQQPFPTLDTSASSDVHGVACSDPLCQALEGHACLVRGCAYQYGYGDKTETFGQLAEDSFTFQAPNDGGTVTVPDLAFGCATYTTGNFNSNESGIAGFGRGPLSLPGQLKVGGFSYCFTAMLEESSKSSPVFLGNPDDLRRRAHATGPIMSTPFVRNPPGHSTYYYLSLKGITVGETRLPVPESAFALKADGSCGTFIDSGSSITQLPHAVFSRLRSEFLAQVPLPAAPYDDPPPPGLVSQQCFFTASVPDASKVPVPKLVLHLEGADWELPRENYMAEDDAGQLCLLINSAGDDDEQLTIIGNFQQQNMHMIHDLAANKLVIVPAQCHKM